MTYQEQYRARLKTIDEVLDGIPDGAVLCGGDVKLMAVAGLVIGWKACIVAFIVGCIAGSIIHVIRMKVSGANHRLALGPYLSMGIWFAMLFSEPIIEWYLRLCGLA